ncbi:MAG TPA: ImmA/IrrE family metallo-endopeptidase [Acidothermaceae bacterium]|jgi:Zn-dependent peptidase ImmA (M78 family)|nr:ImmA/IrrE family metallo-endopeptidase [Acidothermaceae bacterium]
MSRVSRVKVVAQVEAMLNALEELAPGASARLALGAHRELSTWSSLVVRVIPETQTNPGCSVAGAYFAGESPPVLAVAAATSLGRREFTVVHELGHHLQQSTPSLVNELVQQPDGGLELEDAACNTFAGMILLPTDLVGKHIGNRGPTPGDVVALWRGSGASREAACVRAADSLPSPGHVLLLNADGTVALDATHGLPPARRGSDQGDIPVVRDALGRPQHSGTGMTRLAYRDGILGDELYIQVADMDGFLVAVLVTDHAPWEKFAPPSADVGPRTRWWTCEHCGETFQTFDPSCPTCRAPNCTACGRCNCRSKLAERTCTKCYLVLPASRFVGDAVQCEDCS